MNKVSLANRIAEQLHLSRKICEDFIEVMEEIITNTLKQNGEVTIAGFGTFSARMRAGRLGVNPRRPQEKIQIPPVRVAKFKPGKSLKDALKKKE